MSARPKTPRTSEQLEVAMEAAFGAGNIGQTALLAWEALARFPTQSAVPRIYAKKLLRDPYVASISLDTFKSNAKELREADEAEELAELAALGLLRFPAQRYLSLSLLEAAQKLDRHEWLQAIIDALGAPADDDIVLTNVVASYENILGHYERAAALFEKLRRMAPDDETILQNYSASLAGLKRYDEAITLLENYLPQSGEPRAYLNRLLPLYRLAGRDVESELGQLDNSVFAGCDSAQSARVHADLRLFLSDTEGFVFGLQRLLSFGWEAGVAFELAEAQLALGELADGLGSYAVRFQAFPHLAWYSSDAECYTGQMLETEQLFVWAEQGVGDEIMFAMFLEVMVPRVTNMVIALDPRLVPPFSQRYPQWRFVSRFDLPADLPTFDYVCPMGDLMRLFLPGLLEDDYAFSRPVIEPEAHRYREISGLLPREGRPRIAISWRGGQNANGKIRSMELADLMRGLPSEADVDVISLQYDEDHEQEVKELGDRRVALSGLNNRADLEGVFALIRCCDAVITVDNAVAHFATALGVPTGVLIPAAQVQFRWKNPAMKRLLFPGAELFLQEKPGEWSAPVAAAWRYACLASQHPK